MIIAKRLSCGEWSKKQKQKISKAQMDKSSLDPCGTPDDIT